jgi:signal transduction histidine kinase
MGGSVQTLEPQVVDAALAGVVTVTAMASYVGRGGQLLEADEGPLRFTEPDVVGTVLLLLGTVVVFWWRRAPLLVLVVSGVAFFVYHEFGYAPPPLPYVILICLFWLATLWPPARSLATAGVLVTGVVLLYVTRSGPLTDDHFLAYLIAIGATWGLGYGVQLSQARTSLVEQHAAQLQRERDMTTRLAIQQERSRIARDLHDVVAHHVGVIVARAGLEKRAIARRGGDDEALRSIESTGREALTEMRRLLDVLQPSDTEPDAGATRGLDRLDALVREVEGAGLPCTLTVRGHRRPLAADVDSTAYHVVQEALTNALKHAGPTRVEVWVTFGTEWLSVEVLDEGSGLRPESGHGRGLAGMRERVALVGGRLSAGARPEGGFAVRAELPLPVGSQR